MQEEREGLPLKWGGLPEPAQGTIESQSKPVNMHAVIKRAVPRSDLAEMLGERLAAAKPARWRGEGSC